MTIAGPSGVVTSSGDTGPAKSARLFGPIDVAVDSNNNILVSDGNNFRIRSISPARDITTVAGTGPGGFAGVPGPATSPQIAITPQTLAYHMGTLYFANAFTRVLKLSGGFLDIFANQSGFPAPPAADGTPAVTANMGAAKPAFDKSGNMYVADPINNLLWKVDAVTASVKKVAGGGSIVLNATVSSALATQVHLFSPGPLAVDPAGNLYLTDNTNRILKISAHSFNQPLDGSETMTIFAGTGALGFSGDGRPAAVAQLGGPTGLVFDTAGNLYFSDGLNFRIRQIDRSGVIHTVAGTGTAGYTGDGGPALSAQIRPAYMTFDSAGNLYLAEYGNNVVRVLDNIPPVISGMPASGCSLWPADKRMVHVATVTAKDSGAGLAPGSFTVSGTSNEPPTASQIAITPNASGGYDVSLQADRLGTGTGRVYTLTASAKDLAGNVATVKATCTVPHDQAN